VTQSSSDSVAIQYLLPVFWTVVDDAMLSLNGLYGMSRDMLYLVFLRHQKY